MKSLTTNLFRLNACNPGLGLILNATRGFAKESKDSAEFKTIRPFKGFSIDPPDDTLKSTKEELLNFYKTMALYRRVEIKNDELYKNRLIRGFCHLSDGQEACIVGMEAAIKKTDSVIGAYRVHCYQLSRGDSVFSVFSELMWRETGASKGKGGSIHFYYKNFYGGNGIVGAQCPIGVGLAFTHKFRGDGGISVTIYGDGASNQGQLSEAANMAALWKLPVIFVCENNQYGMGTSTARSTANPEYYKKGCEFKTPGIWCNGMDVLAVKKAYSFAADHARSGKGPIFLELDTYRYHGHSMSDPGVSYRSHEEVAAQRAQHDPITLTQHRLIEKGWSTAKELKAIDKEVRAEVEKAAEKAEKSREPAAEELYTNVYYGAPPPYIRTVDPIQSIINKAGY